MMSWKRIFGFNEKPELPRVSANTEHRTIVESPPTPKSEEQPSPFEQFSAELIAGGFTIEEGYSSSTVTGDEYHTYIHRTHRIRCGDRVVAEGVFNCGAENRFKIIGGNSQEVEALNRIYGTYRQKTKG